MKKLLITVTLCSIFSAQAEYYDGEMLYQRLNGDRGDQLAGLGYVAGVIGVVNLPKGGIVCIPTNRVTLGQAAAVVQAGFERNPKLRGETGFAAVTLSLREVWPCKGNK